MQLLDIWNARQALGKLVQADMSAVQSYKLGKELQVIFDEIEVIEKEREKLIRKYATTTTEGMSIKANSMEARKFAQEFSELLAQEADIDFTPPEIDLENISGEFSIQDWQLLDKFIEVKA
jgi:hypothetical protein